MSLELTPRRDRAQRYLPPLAITALLAILAVGVHQRVEAERLIPESEATAPADVPSITDPRTCAAATVYRTATADDWSQRAAIAQATLNGYRGGPAPDCSGLVVAILNTGFDTIRWQAALDAVDAIDRGTYTLPDACARADAVATLPMGDGEAHPLGHDTGLSPARATARAQCVIRDMAFVERQA